MRTHSTLQVAELAGASVRQVDYWATSGLLKPSAKDASGKGTRRRYTFRDVVAAQVIQTLRAGNCPLQKIRAAVKHLRSHYPSESSTDLLAKLVLVTDGKRVYLLTDGNEVMEVITRQAVLCWTVPVGKLIIETESRLHSTPTEWVQDVKVRGHVYNLDVREDDETGEYSVQCRELPGAIEQGRTAIEAVNNGRDAIESVLAYMERHGTSGAQRVAAR